MKVELNEKGLLYLTPEMMTAIFDCVYGLDGYLQKATKKLLDEPYFKDFMQLLITQQQFNYRYRFTQSAELFPLFEAAVGPMERNSDGTTLWLALGLAIKELYGMRKETLKGLLEGIDVSK